MLSHKLKLSDHLTSAELGQIFAENIPADRTNIVSVLQDVINNYFRLKVVGKTKPHGAIILIITDGIQDDLEAVCM
jgi:hypothetical protein